MAIIPIQFTLKPKNVQSLLERPENFDLNDLDDLDDLDDIADPDDHADPDDPDDAFPDDPDDPDPVNDDLEPSSLQLKITNVR